MVSLRIADPMTDVVSIVQSRSKRCKYSRAAKDDESFEYSVSSHQLLTQHP